MKVPPVVAVILAVVLGTIHRLILLCRVPPHPTQGPDDDVVWSVINSNLETGGS